MFFSFISRFFASLALETKITSIITLNCVLILSIATAFIFIRDIRILEENFQKETNLSIYMASFHAQSILYYTEFGKNQKAFDCLDQNENMIDALALYLPDGQLISSWNKKGFKTPDFDYNKVSKEENLQSNELLLSIGPIQKPSAFLILELNNSFHKKRLRNHILFSFFLVLTGSFIAFFLSLYLRRIILKPIDNFLKTVKEINEKKDYSIRAAIMEEEELSILSKGFNDMIEEIERRDLELTRHKQSLQREVVERTIALTAANTKLARLNMALKEAEKRDHHSRQESEKLENQVLERTVALTKANAKLTHFNIELRRAKKRADEASSAKSVFLASMSHELRTPLNGILGYAQLLDREGKYFEKKDQERIQVIKQCGEHLLQMINDILDLAKIEAGKMELEEKDFALASFIESTAEMARNKAREKGLEMTIIIDNKLPKNVKGDEHRLRQVLLNLLGNAIKFTEKGEVCLKVSPDDKLIRFEIIDTGIGIEESKQPLIFKAFSQVKKTGEQIEGTGLGLAISQYIVRMMGGIISVKSIINRGSSFFFSLNLPEAKDFLSKVKNFNAKDIINYQRTDSKEEDIRILIVDDGEENRTFLSEVFKPLNFNVKEAESARKAIALCKEERPDLILMDLIMPGMDGFTCVRYIREIFKEDCPPFIAISASATPDIIEKCINYGYASFISKPVNLQKLFESISQHLPLIWISNKKYTDPEKKKEFLLPEIKLMEKLLALVRSGDIEALQKFCLKFEADTRYPDFIRYTQQLAEQFRIRELNLWLEEAIEKKKKI